MPRIGSMIGRGQLLQLLYHVSEFIGIVLSLLTPLDIRFCLQPHRTLRNLLTHTKDVVPDWCSLSNTLWFKQWVPQKVWRCRNWGSCPMFYANVFTVLPPFLRAFLFGTNFFTHHLFAYFFAGTVLL